MADVNINDVKCPVYEPTPSELKLLEVLCNPECATLNKTEKCAKADISIKTYDRAMEKEGFQKLIKKTSLELVSGNLCNIVNATIRFATSMPQCSADRKVLLQMADMVTEKSEISGKIEMPQIIITK